MPRFPLPRADAFDTNGAPRAGAKLYFYVSGTTTPQTTYSDSALAIPNANPVVADSAGLFGEIFLTSAAAYKVVLKTSADVTVWTADPVTAGTASSDLAGLVNAAAITSTVSEQQAITNKLQFLQAGAGAVTRSIRSKLREVVSVTDFGAALDGVTDDTAAWNLALATGKVVLFPEGSSVITGRLNMTGEGAAIIGQGRDQSIFLISYLTFNMGATAVIQMGDAYQVLKNFGMSFVQPSTTVRANVKQYPPAIDINGKIRAELECLRISGGYSGVRAQGNCGGAVITDIQMGTIFQGFVIDGALDSVRMTSIQCWPFGYSADANLMTVYQDGGNIAADFGRCDDLCIHGMICLSSRLRFADNGSGSTFGYATNVALDTEMSRMEFSAGLMAFANLDCSTNLAADYKIAQSGGDLRISGLQVSGNTQSQPLVLITGTAVFHCSNITAVSNGGSPAFYQSGGVMTLAGGYIKDLSATNRSPAIHVTGGRAIVTGMRASDYLGGVRNFIQVDNDDYHIITGNSFPGWGYSPPVTQAYGVYGPNNGHEATKFINSLLASVPRTKKITGTLDGAGAVTVAHGVAGGQAVTLSVDAWYTAAGSEIVKIASVTVDSTNIILAGGGASRPYTIYVTYI